MAIEIGGSSGGGGVFVAGFASALLAADSGAMFTIDPPTDERVRLTILQTTSGDWASVSITVGGRAILTNKVLSSVVNAQSGFPTNEFAIGNPELGNGNGGCIQEITGGTNESIVCVSNGSESGSAVYAYQTGVLT